MIYLASDHAGFELKELIKNFLEESGIEFIDMGAHTYEKRDDYPDYVITAAEKVAEDPENNRGIVFGGSGQGEAIAANKVSGIRTLVFYGGTLEMVKVSRDHNNSNVLSIGARFVDFEEVKTAIQLWLNTPFSLAERHVRRIRKIADYENRR